MYGGVSLNLHALGCKGMAVGHVSLASLKVWLGWS